MSGRGLFVGLSNVGDAVLTTPALLALHAACPELVFDIVVDRRSAAVYAGCPFRGELVVRDKRAGLAGSLAMVRRLRRRRYEVVADLRTDGLAWLLRARRRLTRRGAATPTGPHAVERHMAVVAPLTGAEPVPPCRVWPGPAAEAAAGRWLSSLPAGRWLALAPGANWPGKIWPPERYAATVGLLAGRVDAVVLLGDARDGALAARVAQAVDLPLLDLCGRTDLMQAAAVLARCRAFVGNDSGLGHLAAAVGTPSVTVFGPGEPERYHPWGPRARWLVAPDRALDALDPMTVAAEVEGLLA